MDPRDLRGLRWLTEAEQLLQWVDPSLCRELLIEVADLFERHRWGRIDLNRRPVPRRRTSGPDSDIKFSGKSIEITRAGKAVRSVTVPTRCST